MDKKRWIKRVLIGTGITAAVALSAKGIEYIKSEIAKDNEKNKTEQVIKDMSAQGISVYKKGEKDAPDSVLTSVNKTHDMWTDSEIYSNPEYKEIGSKKPNTVRLGKEETKLVMSPEEQKLKNDIEGKIVSILKSNSTNEEKDSKIEELLRKMPKEQVKTAQNFEYEEFGGNGNINWSVTSRDAETGHEKRYESTIYNDGSKKVEFETYTFPDAMLSGENIGQKEQRTPQPKSPKRKVSRDALPAKTLADIMNRKKQKNG